MNLISKKAGLAVAIAATLLSVQAQAKTASAGMSVTIKNAFQLSKDKDLSFGEIRAVVDADGTTADECAGIYVSPDPLVTQARALNMTGDQTPSATAVCADGAGDAKMTSLGGTIQPAVFTVSDAADFTDMTVKIPETTTIENPNPTGVDLFFVYPAVYRTTGTAGAVSLTCASSSCDGTVQTDDTGGFSFNLGGGLITAQDAAASTAYGEGPTAFTGSITVTVEYK